MLPGLHVTDRFRLGDASRASTHATNRPLLPGRQIRIGEKWRGPCPVRAPRCNGRSARPATSSQRGLSLKRPRPLRRHDPAAAADDQDDAGDHRRDRLDAEPREQPVQDDPGRVEPFLEVVERRGARGQALAERADLARRRRSRSSAGGPCRPSSPRACPVPASSCSASPRASSATRANDEATSASGCWPKIWNVAAFATSSAAVASERTIVAASRPRRRRPRARGPPSPCSRPRSRARTRPC